MAKRKKTRKGKGWKKRIFNKGTIFTIFACAAVIYFAYSAVLFFSQSGSNTSVSIPYKAVIVDQLSLSQPNQTFIELANSTLINAGFTVDHYSGENVTVDFYRELPSMGYGFIILRAHSAPVNRTAWEKSYISFFTNENYSANRHHADQILGRVVPVRYHEGAPILFGVTPDFFRYSANGRFNNSIIVMMGCFGLTFPLANSSVTMADTLVDLGAKVYVSWNKAVTISRTDLGTLRFLRHFVTDGKSAGKSAFDTNNEIGEDPDYDSILVYYPFNDETKYFVLPKSSLIINVAPTNLESVRRDPRKALSFIN